MTRPQRTSDEGGYDRFYTPKWCTRYLLARELDPSLTLADPCAGGGAIVDVAKELGYQTVACDLHPDARGPDLDVRTEWARHWLRDQGAQVIVTNPPYSCEHGTAAEVLRSLLKVRVPVCALVHQSFLEACEDRADLLRSDRLARIYGIGRVDYRTPSGTAGGAPTDASRWLVWSDEPTDGPVMRWASDREIERAKGQCELFGDQR